MIKNIYDKDNKWYQHEYFCDSCFDEIENGEILRSEEGIKENQFDLCGTCKDDWDRYGELEKELKGGK